MTEIEKMEQGKEYCFLDEAIEQRKKTLWLLAKY